MIKKLIDKLKTKINLHDRIWDVVEICLYAAIALIVAQLVINFVAQRTIVDGDSMYDTLEDGDNIIVEKMSYTFGDIKRYDVVVFPYYDSIKGREVYYIKRIIGLPGETLQIIDGHIYLIDDKTGEMKELDEDYGYYIGDEPMEGFRASEPVHIPEGCYFVLGDNRNNSKDSRQIGLIQGKDILGKAWLRVYPFDKIKLVD